jgi:4-amino-4-deoxy-L-arabinose transferase-like glycosyltransferase
MSTAAEQGMRVSNPAPPLQGIPTVVWVIALGAVVLRLIHAWLMQGDPLYDHPIIDSLESHELAGYLAEVSWLGPPVAYWKPPLYDYFLGVHHALFGSGLWPARISQILLDGCSCILTFALVRRLLSHRAGIVAAAVIALWGPLIYFSSAHVSTSLVVFLELCVLLLAVRAQREPSRSRWVDVGFALGVLAIARAEALLLAPWLAGWLWWSLSRYPQRKRLGWVALLAIGVTVGVAPVALRNALYAGDPVLISANGGVNFYVGSAPEYRGVIGARPGPEWELLMRAPIDVGFDPCADRERPDSVDRAHGAQARACLARP